MFKIKFVFNTGFLKFISPIENICDLYTWALSYITVVLCKMRIIKSYFVPCKTTYLNIGHNYWINLPKHLPPSLTFLKSPSDNNMKKGFVFSLLDELKYYQPSCNLHQPIPLPATIYYVHFGQCFNRRIIFSDNTNNLRYLIFGYKYNQPFKPPPSVKLLTLGYHFDQKIILPTKLTHLKLGYCFKHNIVVPQTLKFLYLDVEHDQILDNLPNTLETLYIHNNYKNPLSNLPNCLKNLELYNVINGILTVHRNTNKYC